MVSHLLKLSALPPIQGEKAILNIHRELCLSSTDDRLRRRVWQQYLALQKGQLRGVKLGFLQELQNKCPGRETESGDAGFLGPFFRGAFPHFWNKLTPLTKEHLLVMASTPRYRALIRKNGYGGFLAERVSQRSILPLLTASGIDLDSEEEGPVREALTVVTDILVLMDHEARRYHSSKLVIDYWKNIDLSLLERASELVKRIHWFVRPPQDVREALFRFLQTAHAFYEMRRRT